MKRDLVDIEELIRRSSFGEPGATKLRARTPPDVAAAIVLRSEAPNPGGMAGPDRPIRTSKE